MLSWSAVQSPCLEVGMICLAEVLSKIMRSVLKGCLEEKVDIEMPSGLIETNGFENTIMEAEQKEDPDSLLVSAGIVEGCWFFHMVTIISSVGIKCLNRPEWPSLASCGVSTSNHQHRSSFMFTSHLQFFLC